MYGIVYVLNCFDMNPIWVLYALACNYKVSFDTNDGVWRFS